MYKKLMMHKKIQYTIVLLFISLRLFGQEGNETVVYGHVTSEANDFQPFSYTGIRYKQYDTIRGWISSTIAVDSNGVFKKSFPQNTKLAIRTNYSDVFTTDTTTIYTSSLDSLSLHFIVHPKQYTYSDQQAKKDIAAGLIQLITYDSLIFHWDQKIHFTKPFGFRYLLLSKPRDYDIDYNIDKYNEHVKEYLSVINDSTWIEKLIAIEDSLIHIKADNYAKQNHINLTKLSFPSKAVLSNRMKEKVEKQGERLERYFGSNKEEFASFTPDFLLDKIDNDPNYYFMLVAEYWLANYYEQMIPQLIIRLTDKKEVGLINTADLIIDERITSGDLNFYGHGGVAFDDLFRVAGRANHLLRSITGEDFGSVSMYATDKDLKKLQNRWAYWLMNIKIQ